jgi:hypothetical protein
MIQNTDGYTIEFSENHDPEKVLRFTKDCTPELRAQLVRQRTPMRGWAVFKVKHGTKTATGNIYDTEEKAKAIVAHWLRIHRDRAARAAHRATDKADRLAELAGSDPIDTGSLMTKLYGVGVNTVEKVTPVKEVAPYVWEISEADRILAHGLGIQL